jgi:hypothetical protein
MFDKDRFYLGRPADGTPLFGVPYPLFTVNAARRVEVTSIIICYSGASTTDAYLNLCVSGTGGFDTRAQFYDLGPYGPNTTETFSDGDLVVRAGEQLAACQFFHSGAVCQVLTLTVNGREIQV